MLNIAKSNPCVGGQDGPKNGTVRAPMLCYVLQFLVQICWDKIPAFHPVRQGTWDRIMHAMLLLYSYSTGAMLLLYSYSTGFEKIPTTL